MSRIPDEIIQQVRDRIDVVELVGRSVSLKRAGRSYKGLCPFHHEKTPSFNVNPDRGTFYCFGCHEGGDAIAFVQKTEGLGFLDAVRSLARDCGVVIPESGGGGNTSSGLSERIYEANALLLERYRAELKQPGCPGAAYLAERGLSPEEWDRFEIGWAPDRWDFAVGVLRAAKISMELAETAGIVTPRQTSGHYDRLRGRVVFPIRDARGRVLGFGGRAIAKDQEPKYLNTPETPVFRKREALYGLPKALEAIRQSEFAVVVEGYFDQIALCRAGVECAVATNGTALTPDHARALLRRSRNVVVLFDGDGAGERALARGLEILLPEGLRVRAAELPAKEDPDSFLRKHGPDALRAVIEKAVPALDLIIDRAARPGHESPWQKADAVASVAPLLARVPTALDRAEYCARLAMAVGTEVRHVEAAVRAAERGEDAREAVPVGPRRAGPEDRNVRQLARCLVEHPALAAELDRAELVELLPRGPHSELALALVEASVAGRGVVRVPELAGTLSEEARALLHALSVDGDPVPESNAARTVRDTIAWLRDQRRKRDASDIKRRMHATQDPQEKSRLFDEMQRILERRRDESPPADHTPVGPPA